MRRILFALSFVAATVGATETNIITVYKDPNCGCCGGWVSHMKQAGFEVREVNSGNDDAVQQKFGVPSGMASCHTAVVEGTGQVISGHVPAAAVRKMIESPDTKGVAVPGMPMNSPGMGRMNGQLVTLDFNGKPFSKD